MEFCWSATVGTLEDLFISSKYTHFVFSMQVSTIPATHMWWGEGGSGTGEGGSGTGGFGTEGGGLAQGEGGLAWGRGSGTGGGGIWHRGGVSGTGGGGIWHRGVVVIFQSVHRCTHECYWFLSHQHHLDGPLRATIKNLRCVWTTGSTMYGKNQAQSSDACFSPIRVWEKSRAFQRDVHVKEGDQRQTVAFRRGSRTACPAASGRTVLIWENRQQTKRNYIMSFCQDFTTLRLDLFSQSWLNECHQSRYSM